MKKFTVQMRSTVVLSRTIKAESMEDALKQAQAMANKEENGVTPLRGWSYEWCEETKVNAILC